MADCNPIAAPYLRAVQTPPILTDRAILDRHRARASDPQDDGALYLHRAAADEIEDRLQEVNRTFTNVAIVTGHMGFWGSRFPQATMVPDADTLVLTPGTQDLVLHVMALHWANDPVGQLVQCRRALRPDGLFLAIAPGGRTLVELRATLAEAETAVSGGLSPRVAPMAEIRDLGGLLQRAGLALPVADVVTLTVSHADQRALMHDLRAMGEGNALLARHRYPPRRTLFDRAAALHAQHFPDASDPARIRSTVDLCVLTGWAPSADQPQPLRPGSATGRLADALGAVETSLHDTALPNTAQPDPATPRPGQTPRN